MKNWLFFFFLFLQTKFIFRFKMWLVNFYLLIFNFMFFLQIVLQYTYHVHKTEKVVLNKVGETYPGTGGDKLHFRAHVAQRRDPTHTHLSTTLFFLTLLFCFPFCLIFKYFCRSTFLLHYSNKNAHIKKKTFISKESGNKNNCCKLVIKYND